MDNVILFISTILMISFGYYVMCRIDNYLETRDDTILHVDNKNIDLLLYKCPKEIYSLLDANNISYEFADCTTIYGLPRFRMVLAFSESDLDNLILCYSAKRNNPYSKTIARCNSKVYQEIFMREEIDAVIFTLDQGIAILNEWKVIN